MIWSEEVTVCVIHFSDFPHSFTCFSHTFFSISSKFSKKIGKLVLYPMNILLSLI